MSILKLSGVASAVVAVMHVVIVVLGGPAYRYFGAGEGMARMAESGSPLPAVLTGVVGALCAAWGAYAFSGAGIVRRLPLLRTSLILIGLAYLGRGLLLGPQLVWRFSGFTSAVPPRQLAFSGAALLIGMGYLAGTKQAWHSLGAPRAR